MSMPTIPSKYNSGVKSPEKHSPVTQLAQLEREQKLRQENQIKSSNSNTVNLVEEETSKDENVKIEGDIRVRLDCQKHKIFILKLCNFKSNLILLQSII